MGRAGNRQRRAAAAAAAGRGPRPGSPEARLQVAFVRIARADDLCRQQVMKVYEQDPYDLMQAAFAEERKASDLEWRRRAVFERFTAPGDPDREELDRRTRPQESGLFSLLHEFSELLDGCRSLTAEESDCIFALHDLLSETVRAADRPPPAPPAPPEPVPELAGALSRLEEIAGAFAAIDAKQAAVLADPALAPEDKEERIAEWHTRQQQYIDDLLTEAGG